MYVYVYIYIYIYVCNEYESAGYLNWLLVSGFLYCKNSFFFFFFYYAKMDFDSRYEHERICLLHDTRKDSNDRDDCEQRNKTAKL